MHKDYSYIKDNLKIAFKKLRKQGYFCRMNFWCCQTCGFAGVPKGKSRVVFYHKQDEDGLKKDGYVYLAWAGNGKEIVSAINEAGLKTDWTGTEDKRIKVTT